MSDIHVSATCHSEEYIRHWWVPHIFCSTNWIEVSLFSLFHRLFHALQLSNSTPWAFDLKHHQFYKQKFRLCSVNGVYHVQCFIPVYCAVVQNHISMCVCSPRETKQFNWIDDHGYWSVIINDTSKEFNQDGTYGLPTHVIICRQKTRAKSAPTKES